MAWMLHVGRPCCQARLGTWGLRVHLAAWSWHAGDPLLVEAGGKPDLACFACSHGPSQLTPLSNHQVTPSHHLAVTRQASHLANGPIWHATAVVKPSTRLTNPHKHPQPCPLSGCLLTLLDVLQVNAKLGGCNVIMDPQRMPSFTTKQDFMLFGLAPAVLYLSELCITCNL